MEDDLTWLARNVTDSHMCDWYIKVADGYSSMTGGTPTGMSGTWSSREQIIQRRADLRNKPSWADAPEWANWLGQTSRGSWEWYQGVQAPDHRDDGCFSYQQLGESSGKYGEVLGDWRDTLERRPRDLSEPAVIARLTEATENVLAAVPALIGEKLSIDRNDWFVRGERPPLGRCMVKHKQADAEWAKPGFNEKNIVAAGEKLFIERDDDGQEFVGAWDDYEFRPLCTERDLAVDEMMKCTLGVMNQETQRRLFEDLYDAGYRKQNLPAK